MNIFQSSPYTAANILNVQSDNYRTKTFVLDAAIEAEPGQFVMVWLPGFDEKPFSLVANDPVTVMVTAVGPTTRLIREKQTGDRLWVRGPFGRGFTVESGLKHALLVGGGYGVAPLLFLAHRLCSVATRIEIAIGAQTAADILYADRFSSLSTHSVRAEIALHLATDDGTGGHQGLVTAPAAQVIAQHKVDCVYACGPHAMLGAVRKLAQSASVPCELSWEEYMRCGMGLCGSCEHEGQLLCMDGPVIGYAA